MSKFIALYLPQYYPTPENDEWWGKGFTDWRTVASAKPLFRGHIQPKIPGDLGFYDLRVPETRMQQAKLARENGIDGFCYWHYWFGEGKQLLTKPLEEVLESKEPDFPFCLGWANHSWYKKEWGGKGKDKLLIEQKYLGEDDDRLHFEKMLPYFKDKRYIRHDGKLLFFVYVPLADEHIKQFIELWRKLALENGLNDFFFVGKDSYSRNKDKILSYGFDAVYNDNIFGILHKESKFQKAWRYLLKSILKYPMIFKYKDAIKYMLTEEERKEDVIPTIVPNWDHSPRSGASNAIFVDSKPIYFERLVRKVCDIIKNKHNDIVLVKSWNEWAEGNYLEPDLQYGDGMLKALKKGREYEK